MFTFSVKYTLNGWESHYQEVEATSPSDAIMKFLSDHDNAIAYGVDWRSVEIQQLSLIVPKAQWNSTSGNINKV